jgi:hypothetical protein
MRAASARRRAPAAADDDRRLSGWHRRRAGQQNAEQDRAGEEVPRQVPGTDKGEALDQLFVSDDVATDLLLYQVEEDARLSQGRDPRFLVYLTLPCMMLLCTLRFEFISDA